MNVTSIYFYKVPKYYTMFFSIKILYLSFIKHWRMEYTAHVFMLLKTVLVLLNLIKLVVSLNNLCFITLILLLD